MQDPFTTTHLDWTHHSLAQLTHRIRRHTTLHRLEKYGLCGVARGPGSSCSRGCHPLFLWPPGSLPASSQITCLLTTITGLHLIPPHIRAFHQLAPLLISSFILFSQVAFTRVPSKWGEGSHRQGNQSAACPSHPHWLFSFLLCDFQLCLSFIPCLWACRQLTAFSSLARLSFYSLLAKTCPSESTDAYLSFLQTSSVVFPMEKEMATHSSILAWEIPWTEKPGSYSHGVTKEVDMT